jgi:hypothetical protein
MKAREILNQYSDTALDKVASDKIDEAVNLRLPRSVIIQEISEALNSLTYVAGALAPTRPPTYTFLKLLLEAPGYSCSIEGFQDLVFSETKIITEKAASGKGLSADKNYQLYLKILKTAWEDDVVERSEALLLETLRKELGMWTREHLLLEHHPDITSTSNFSNSFVPARNHLLLTGLVLTLDHNYILAEEVALQIRRAWEIELSNTSYKRLLNELTKKQLYNILEQTSLLLTGSKDEQIERIANALVPPAEALDFLHIDELRELARDTKAQVSGLKAEVIGNLIEHFDQGLDLLKTEEKIPEKKLPDEPEERVLSENMFMYLLKHLTIDQLYDALSASFLKTSGSKETKINRLIESPWSEHSILSRLRRIELSNLCRKLGVQISGVKSELIDRLIEWPSSLLNNGPHRPEPETTEPAQHHKTENGSNIAPNLSDIDAPNAAAMPIPGLDDLKIMYPGLEPDEHIILALIKETKSLTEQDVERVSKRHGLEWYLTKAHMAELVAKLKRIDKLPIRVKSIRNTNIYEWHGIKDTQKKDIEKLEARDVIKALRQGVVPGNGLNLLATGQENTRDHLMELLEDIHNGKSAFKFIRGPYGAGKTFLCSWLRQYALDNEFVVSLINIGPDQPLSDLPIFFSGIINGLRTPEKRDSSALADVLESWLLTVHRKTAQIEGLKAFDKDTIEELMPLVENRIESDLAAISNIEPCFSPALRSFYRARIKGDQITVSNAIAWMSGSRSIPSDALKEIGVRGYLEANQVFSRMRALLEIVAGSRFKGLLLMVDELELIRKFPHARQREQALETLRLLIDETGKNGFPGCLLIFTGTDTFFEDDRAGLKSYEALDNRVASPGGPNGMISVRQPVVCLEGLNRERLISVARKLRNIHGIAYEWDSVNLIPDDFIVKLVQEWTSFGEENITRKPRPVLREFINILDLFEENPGVNLNEVFEMPMDNTAMAKEFDDILSG